MGKTVCADSIHDLSEFRSRLGADKGSVKSVDSVLMKKSVDSCVKTNSENLNHENHLVINTKNEGRNAHEINRNLGFRS